ncbi:MAG: DUF4252 domain-containing protein [Candidatus Aminicenantes bacterium]|nr:MAG: DUF4252 domain-containing protein [Candidatus Aminicenantes bacterium]
MKIRHPAEVVAVVVVVVLVAAGTAAAQAGTSHPGYYPIENMGVLAKGDLEVDIDLTGAMLQVAAGAMQSENGEDEDLAKLVAGLERIRVQVGAPQGADATTIAHSFDSAISTMEGAGWSRILRVVDEGEQVYLFARENAGRIAGLTALINDENEEIVLVNLVGDIDPVVLGKVIAKADRLPDLEQFMAGGN